MEHETNQHQDAHVHELSTGTGEMVVVAAAALVVVVIVVVMVVVMMVWLHRANDGCEPLLPYCQY